MDIYCKITKTIINRKAFLNSINTIGLYFETISNMKNATKNTDRILMDFGIIEFETG